MKYESFDIFDTCLIRECGDAENVFFLLGRKLFGADSTDAEMFFHWRCQAEGIVAQKLNKKNVSIEEIYSLIPSNISGKYTQEQLIKEEMLMESEMLHVIPSIRKKIKDKREEKCQIVFISDMYLPSSFLMDILLREGIAMNGDVCFVSCECGASKSSGSLYSYVTKKMKAKPICHHGDNLWSDVRMAKKHGIKTCHISSDYNDVEKQILKKVKNKRCYLSYSCLVGAMRFARLTQSESFSSEISSDFVAPILTAYVLACLRKAEIEKLDCLYFLARDGYILLWIARLFSSLFPSIDLRYLYVSRKSMYLPSLTSIEKCEIEKYFGDGLKYTPEKQIIKYFKQKEWNEKIILSDASAARKRIEEYFEGQDIYNDKIKYALVDIGWKGSGRYAFNKLMRLKGCPEREMWYWGTFKSWRMNFEGHFWTYNINLELPLYFITLVEDFFSTSPDLSTIDYNNGQPIFDKSSLIDNTEILAANKSSLKKYIHIVRDFQIIEQPVLDDLSSMCCNILVEHPEYFNLKPLVEMNCFSEKDNNRGLVHTPKLIDITKYVLGRNNYSGWMEGNLAFYCKKLLTPLRAMRRCSLWLKSKVR